MDLQAEKCPRTNRGSGPKRKWTDEENEALRAGWKRGCVASFAKRFGRSKTSVSQHATWLGLAIYRKRTCDPELLEFIREQHAAGLLDTEMHRAWNDAHPSDPVTRERICYVRRKFLGLDKNHDQLKACKQRAYKRQMEVLGIKSMPDLWERHMRRQALKHGWPADVRPLEIQILDVMLDGEFRTRAEIAAAIGLRSNNQREWFKTSSGSQSAIANLVNRGLLRRSSRRTRRSRTGGSGRTSYEYWMPLEVRRSRPRQRLD